MKNSKLWKIILDNNLGGSGNIPRLQQSSENKLTFVVNYKNFIWVSDCGFWVLEPPADLPDSLEPGTVQLESAGWLEGKLHQPAKASPAGRRGQGHSFVCILKSFLTMYTGPFGKNWASGLTSGDQELFFKLSLIIRNFSSSSSIIGISAVALIYLLKSIF